MNNSVNDIINSLENYDKNMEKYDKLSSKFKYSKIIHNSSDLDHDEIIFYDKNQEQIFRSKYEKLGLYTYDTNAWIWAWSVPSFTKNATYLSKKILKYGLEIPSDSANIFLKSELITSRIRITDPAQIDIHVAVASYISKIPFIYKYKYANNMIDIYDKIKLIPQTTDNNVVNNIVYLFLLDDEKNINK
jgi:hypothetical protein